MTQNRLFTQDWYEAKGRLDIAEPHDVGHWTSIDGLVKQIAYIESIEPDQNPPVKNNRWLIIHGHSSTIYVSDGAKEQFQYESKTRKAVGVYDNGKVTLFDDAEDKHFSLLGEERLVE
jgi:hypothetical protein